MCGFSGTIGAAPKYHTRRLLEYRMAFSLQAPFKHACPMRSLTKLVGSENGDLQSDITTPRSPVTYQIHSSPNPKILIHSKGGL